MELTAVTDHPPSPLLISSCLQIIEACWATRETSGGLMELQALLKYVNRRRGKQTDPVSEDDVVREGGAGGEMMGRGSSRCCSYTYVIRRRGKQADPVSEDDVVGASVRCSAVQPFCPPPSHTPTYLPRVRAIKCPHAHTRRCARSRSSRCWVTATSRSSA